MFFLAILFEDLLIDSLFFKKNQKFQNFCFLKSSFKTRVVHILIWIHSLQCFSNCILSKFEIISLSACLFHPRFSSKDLYFVQILLKPIYIFSLKFLCLFCSLAAIISNYTFNFRKIWFFPIFTKSDSLALHFTLTAKSASSRLTYWFYFHQKLRLYMVYLLLQPRLIRKKFTNLTIQLLNLNLVLSVFTKRKLYISFRSFNLTTEVIIHQSGCLFMYK